MERPNPKTIAYDEGMVPDDPRAEKGQMFAHPCAFVNGNTSFGTFAQTVVARVGERRVEALAKKPRRAFEPMSRRPWKAYVQITPGSIPDDGLAALAAEALAWTAKLPAKPGKKPKAATRPEVPKAAKKKR